MNDCYFYTTTRDGDDYVVPVCTECYDEDGPGTGWFWNGSERGYGPFLFECNKCGKIIYKPEEGDQVAKD